jgi:hypothetical protein
MAGPIASRLSLILPRVLARVQSVLGASPPSGFTALTTPLVSTQIIVSQDPLGKFPVVLGSPDQFVVLSIEEVFGPAQGEHGGGPEEQLKRGLGVCCWTRAEVDESHQHILILTQQAAAGTIQFNHLDLEEQTFAALQIFFVSDTQTPPNQISSQPMQLLSWGRPEKPIEEANKFWLRTTFKFEIKWTPVVMPTMAFYPAAYH